VSLLGDRATFTLAGTIFAAGGLVAALTVPRVVGERGPARAEGLPDSSPVRAR
jgi:hypothetical protein